MCCKLADGYDAGWTTSAILQEISDEEGNGQGNGKGDGKGKEQSKGSES